MFRICNKKQYEMHVFINEDVRSLSRLGGALGRNLGYMTALGMQVQSLIQNWIRFLMIFVLVMRSISGSRWEPKSV